MDIMFNLKLYPIELLDEVKKYLTVSDEKKSKYIPKLTFLCGEGLKEIEKKGLKKEATNRHVLKEYLDKYGESRVHSIFVEELWKRFGSVKKIDLLTYEHYLAESCDSVILFSESLGTAAELGAFSLNDDLVKKLIVIIDSKYEGDDSFINNGPVEKINSLAKGNVIYCNLKSSMESSDLINKMQEYIQLKKTCEINKDIKKVLVHSYLMEILDIIYLLGPISDKDVFYIYKYLKDFKGHMKFNLAKYEPRFAIDYLSNIGLIHEYGNNYYDVNAKKYKNYGFILFNINEIKFYSLRSKFLARKYKYLSKELKSWTVRVKENVSI